MDAISNPAHARRGDRRRTLRQVDDAFARGTITAADRATRVAQIEAAVTRGDLAMVVRGIDDRVVPQRTTPPSVTTAGGRPAQDRGAMPPHHGAPPQHTGTLGAPTAQAPGPPPGSGSGMSTGLRVVVGTLVAVLALCGGGVTLMTAVFRSAVDAGSSPSATTGEEPSPVTGPGWDVLVEETEDRFGTVEIHGVSLFETSAFVTVREGGRLVTHSRRGGTWEEIRTQSLPERLGTIDMRSISASTLDDVVRQSVAEAGVDEEDVSRQVYVSAYEPEIIVVQLSAPQRTIEPQRFSLTGAREPRDGSSTSP